MAEPTNEAEALALLKRLQAIGCPTYYDNSGSRTRDGRACCIFCDEVLEAGGTHADECLWRKVEEVATRPEEQDEICVRCGEPGRVHGPFGFRDHAPTRADGTEIFVPDFEQGE